MTPFDKQSQYHLLSQTAVLPGSDSGSDGLEQYSLFLEAYVRRHFASCNLF